MVECDGNERGFHRISRFPPMCSEWCNVSALNVERNKIGKLKSNSVHSNRPKINAPRHTQNPCAHTRLGFAQSC